MHSSEKRLAGDSEPHPEPEAGMIDQDKVPTFLKAAYLLALVVILLDLFVWRM